MLVNAYVQTKTKDYNPYILEDIAYLSANKSIEIYEQINQLSLAILSGTVLI